MFLSTDFHRFISVIVHPCITQSLSETQIREGKVKAGRLLGKKRRKMEKVNNRILIFFVSLHLNIRGQK
jgi:hypothetical protein